VPEAVELVRRLAGEWIRSLENYGRITVSPQQSSKILHILVTVLKEYDVYRLGEIERLKRQMTELERITIRSIHLTPAGE
jgi:hypothetical protein